MNRNEFSNGLILGGSAAVALLLIVLVYQLTHKSIEKTAEAQLNSNLNQLLSKNSYDNNPAKDIKLLSDPALGSDKHQPVYRAREQGQPTGAVVTAIAPDGYNGAIELLIGLSYEGSIVAVRAISHDETPGLGDDIDARRSQWIHSFDSLSPDSMAPENWQVKKDGGIFDQFTGATITPRAVIHSVYRVSQWYQANRNAIFE